MGIRFDLIAFLQWFLVVVLMKALLHRGPFHSARPLVEVPSRGGHSAQILCTGAVRATRPRRRQQPDDRVDENP